MERTTPLAVLRIAALVSSQMDERKYHFRIGAGITSG